MDTQHTFRMTLQLAQPLTIFGLVLGGHFPLTLLAGHTILIDRNILSLLKNSARSVRPHAEADRYWLEQLNDPTIKIALGLCSLEGPNRRALSFDEFFAEHDAAYGELQPLLPKAQVLTYGPEIRRDVYQVQVELQARYEAECTFLMEAAPLVAERHGDDRLPTIEHQILESARRLKLTGHSLAIIAILGCLYDAKDGSTPSIPRHVLKPRKAYDSMQAHNAISDLRSLEMLARSTVVGLGRIALCTADRGLGAFWCALQVKNPKWINGSFSFDFDLNQKLFPRLPEADVARLLSELAK